MDINLDFIPRDERNENFVLVVTEQFIEETHGPTKTALDRCKTLIEKMGKTVLLINTAEWGEGNAACPFFKLHKGNYNVDKQNLEAVYWKGVTIPFVQCENNMPNAEGITILLEMVRAWKPAYIIAIGGTSIFANLANKIIPVLGIGLCPSDLESMEVKYQTLSRKVTEEDLRIMKKVGKDEKHIINGIFTSGLKEQREHLTRSQLGLREDQFILAVVGGRLDDEITDKFMQMLDDILSEERFFTVFIGTFDHYENIDGEKYPNLKKQSMYMGFCQDILSRMECCDLYVNPIRKGGGTSGVEALFKGLPVVTTNYGDVAVNSGETFWVKDYEEMKLRVRQYERDKQFYRKQSYQAIERAKVLLDTDGEFVKIIQEMERREVSE